MIFSYKTASGSSQYRFGVLAKIVKHMKQRHQEGETYALTLEEILDETNQLDVGNKVKQVSSSFKQLFIFELTHLPFTVVAKWSFGKQSKNWGHPRWKVFV